MEIDCSLKENANHEKCKKAVGEAVFSMIIPKGDNSRSKIKVDEIKKYITKINTNFGGSTTKPVTIGCYNDPNTKKPVCESGLMIQTFRDFDSPYENLSGLNAIERIKTLDDDHKFLKGVAEEIANDFGQDSIPVIFDNISDISYVKGEWKKSIEKNKLMTKKLSKNPFNQI